MFHLSDEFWQQEIPESKFPKWFVQRKVGFTCNLVCGFLHIALGVATLLIMNNCIESRAVTYTSADNGREVELIVSDEMAQQKGPIFMHVEVDGIYTNYRTFTSSKDDHIAGASASKFQCTGGETVQDFVFMRGIEFLMSPPPKYVNVDGFFDTVHPLRDTDKNVDRLASSEINEMDVLRHRDAITDPWTIIQVNPDAGVTVDMVRALASNFVERNAPHPRPCGLNSFTMFLDNIELAHSNGSTVPLDESDLAWDTDVQFIKDTKKGVFTGLHLWENDVDNGRKITMGDAGKHVLSWLNGSLESDGEKVKDAAFQRLLAWYRNFASPAFRLLLGKYDNLPAATYKLRFVYVDKAWESWGTERKIILSTLSDMGSYNLFLPAVCISVGTLQVVFALFLGFTNSKIK